MKFILVLTILTFHFAASAEERTGGIPLKNSRLVFQALQKTWPQLIETSDGLVSVEIAQFHLHDVFCVDTGKETKCIGNSMKNGGNGSLEEGMELYLALINAGVNTIQLPDDSTYKFLKLHSLFCTRVRILDPRQNEPDYSCQIEYPTHISY